MDASDVVRMGRRYAGHFDFRNVATWLVFGAILGVVAGLGAILFQMALEAVRLFCFESLIGIRPGHPGGEPPDFAFPLAHEFVPYLLVVLPALGGLAAGLLVTYLAPEARGHGTDAAIRAYHRQGGVIKARVPIVKFFATVLTMGTGGSGGREGPIAQIGAGFGSLLATRFGLGVKYRRMLLAAGLGAGVGAIFRAPLAGALFAAEVLYSDPEVESEVILPAAVTTIIAYAVFAAKYGYGHMFTSTQQFGFSNPLELLPYLVLALIVAAAALVYIQVFYGTEALFERIQLPRWLKPAIGGAMTGALGLALFWMSDDVRALDVLSTGYGVLQDVIGGVPGIGVGLLLLIAGGKVLTTSLTIGSGGSAGVFGPSMVIGGTLGAAVGEVLHGFFPEMVTHPASFAIVGMAGFFAAAAKTPISTVVMVSEMTGNYQLLVPSVWVCALAYLVGRRWTIFRSQVRSKVHSPAHFGEYAMAIMGSTRVAEIYKRDRRFVTVTPDATLSDVVQATSGTRQRVFPIVDRRGCLVGGLHLPELLHAIETDPAASRKTCVRTIAHVPMTVCLGDDIAKAHRIMSSLAADEVMVVDDLQPDRIVGVLAASDVLLAYNRKLAEVEETPSGLS